MGEWPGEKPTPHLRRRPAPGSPRWFACGTHTQTFSANASLHRIRGSSPEIVPPFFLFWREPLFFLHRKSPKTQPTSNRPATNRHLFFDNNELTLPHHRKFICLFPAAMVDDVKIWRSSRHVESLSTWRDDRLLLFFLSCCSVTCLKKICCVISLFRTNSPPSSLPCPPQSNCPGQIASTCTSGGGGGPSPGARSRIASPCTSGGGGGSSPGARWQIASPCTSGGGGGPSPGAPSQIASPCTLGGGEGPSPGA